MISLDFPLGVEVLGGGFEPPTSGFLLCCAYNALLLIRERISDYESRAIGANQTKPGAIPG